MKNPGQRNAAALADPADGVVLPPADVSSSRAAGRARRSRRRFVLVLAILILASAVGAWALVGAWRETSRREAYLPDLEAQARRAPDDGRLLALLGARLAQAGDRAAVATFERAVAAGAADAPVWIAWAASEAASGNVAKAQAILRTGIRAAPAAGPSLQAALDRCRGLGSSSDPGDFASAIAPEEDRALLREYAAGSFLNGLAEWWGRGHPKDSGFATRERWAREAPAVAAVQTLWGRALLTNRRLPEAAAVLRKALELDPDSPETRLAVADVLYRDEAFDAAGGEYEACLRLRPDWLPALIGLGKVAVQQGAYSVGIDLFTRATRQAPQSADAWAGLGSAYYQQHLQVKRALQAFEKAAQLAPERTDFFLDYADALRSGGQLDAAESLMRRRLAAEPGDVYAYWLLSMLLTSNRPSAARSAEAEQLLRAGIPRVAAPALIVVRLGQLLLERGEPEEAARVLAPITRAGPDSNTAQAMALLAQAYRRMRRPAEAKAMQENSVRLTAYAARRRALMEQARRDPMNPDVHRKMARLLQSNGEPELARQYLETASLLEAQAEPAPGRPRREAPRPEEDDG